MTTSSDSELAADLSRASDIDRLRLVLLRIARRIRTNSISSITPSQLAVLGTVLRHGRLTVGQIADYEHVKPPSVSKIVAALESLGYVERATDPNDRRCTFITVTTAGHTYADEIRSAGRTWLAEQVDVISPTDITAIEAALPALERLLGGGE